MNSCLLRISMAMLVAAMGIGWTTLKLAGAIPATSNPIRRRLRTDYHNGASSEYSLNPFRALRVVANVYVGTVVKRNDVSKDPVVGQYGSITFKIDRVLYGKTLHRLILPYWSMGPGRKPFGQFADVRGVWPALYAAPARPQMLLIVIPSAYDKIMGSQKGVTVAASDAVVLWGPDDPIIENIARIIALWKRVKGYPRLNSDSPSRAESAKMVGGRLVISPRGIGNAPRRVRAEATRLVRIFDAWLILHSVPPFTTLHAADEMVQALRRGTTAPFQITPAMLALFPRFVGYNGTSTAARDRLLAALAYRIIKSIPNGGGITTRISKTGPVTSHHFTEGRSVATYQMLHALKQTVTQSWCAGRRKVLLPRTRQDLIAAMRRIRRLGKEPAAHDATLISAWLGKKHE